MGDIKLKDKILWHTKHFHTLCFHGLFQGLSYVWIPHHIYGTKTAYHLTAFAIIILKFFACSFLCKDHLLVFLFMLFVLIIYLS